MSDKPIIIAGLAGFVVLVTFPFWYPLVLGQAFQSPPAREYPQDVRCIEKKEWMAANHMNLLKQWRKEVVRSRGPEAKPYESESGKEYAKSLTDTCMACHGKKDMLDGNGDTSCTQCHNYAGIEPDCWNCHIEPEGN